MAGLAALKLPSTHPAKIHVLNRICILDQSRIRVMARRAMLAVQDSNLYDIEGDVFSVKHSEKEKCALV